MLLNRKILDKRMMFDIKELDRILRSKNAYKNFFMFIMGTLISAIAVSVLYEPYDIVVSVLLVS